MPDEPDIIPFAEPLEQEPTVTKAPPAGRQFPCPACGARLDYDPTSSGLKCPYCGYTEEILHDTTAEIVEHDYFAYLDNQQDCIAATLEGRSSEVRCGGCGAVVLLEDKVLTERCPFCATHLENRPVTASAMIPPESLLPFTVDLRTARERFTQWLHGLWFAPNELKRVANLGQMSGVYLPHWTYDAMTYTRYTGQRGDNYLDTVYVTVRNPDGSTSRQARTVTKIRWRPVSGEVRHFFDDVLVCGSKSLPADLVRALEPWELEKMDPYQCGYLSGFKTERYSVGLKEGFVLAKERMQPVIDQLIRRDIGGDHQQISSKKTRYQGVTFKHLLLPMWVAVYRYEDKTYQILVNGRNGKVTGYRPYSWVKIAAVVLAAIVAAAVIAAIWARSH